MGREKIREEILIDEGIYGFSSRNWEVEIWSPTTKSIFHERSGSETGKHVLYLGRSFLKLKKTYECDI